MVRTLDLQSTGRGFDSRPPHCRVATLDKSFTRAQRLWSYDRIRSGQFRSSSPVETWILWWSPELWDLFCTSFDRVVCTRLELYYDFMNRIIILCFSYLATWLPFLNKPIDWLIGWLIDKAGSSSRCRYKLPQLTSISCCLLEWCTVSAGCDAVSWDSCCM